MNIYGLPKSPSDITASSNAGHDPLNPRPGRQIMAPSASPALVQSSLKESWIRLLAAWDPETSPVRPLRHRSLR